MASKLVRELLDTGIHFGHRVSRWNPKMQPYIFGKRNMIHIIDIKETLKGLLRAKKYLERVVAEGQDVLFVGTKRQAKSGLETHAKRCKMHYITERWLGGTLTNFSTIRARLARLEELERLEETGELANYSKKMIATLQREKRKITRNLGGIRNMTKLPGVLVVIDVGHEHIAVREAKKLGIPTICLIDTDGDLDYADIPIPGNEDSIRAIEIISRELADSVIQGFAVRPEEPETPASIEPERPRDRPERARPRRRPPHGRAAPAAPSAPAVAAPPTPAPAAPSAPAVAVPPEVPSTPPEPPAAPPAAPAEAPPTEPEPAASKPPEPKEPLPEPQPEQ